MILGNPGIKPITKLKSIFFYAVQNFIKILLNTLKLELIVYTF